MIVKLVNLKVVSWIWSANSKWLDKIWTFCQCHPILYCIHHKCTDLYSNYFFIILYNSPISPDLKVSSLSSTASKSYSARTLRGSWAELLRAVEGYSPALAPPLMVLGCVLGDVWVSFRLSSMAEIVHNTKLSSIYQINKKFTLSAWDTKLVYCLLRFFLFAIMNS